MDTVLPEITWGSFVKPGARWLLHRLPYTILRRYYSREELEADTRILLETEGHFSLRLPGTLQVPSFNFGVRVLNVSPYVDVRIQGVKSFLSATNASGQGGPFATFDKWLGQDLRRGESRYLRCDYWLNEFQLGIFTKLLHGECWIKASVFVWLQSGIGFASPSKTFSVVNPIVDRTS
jgi:hypothetical protein